MADLYAADCEDNLSSANGVGTATSLQKSCHEHQNLHLLQSKTWATNSGRSRDWAKSKVHTPQAGILRRALCILRFVILVFVIVSLANGIYQSPYYTPPQHYRDLDGLLYASTLPGRGNINKEKVYIAANIIDEDLIRGAWGQSLLRLVDLLGHENVFVSIYENDSGNGTSAALQELQGRLLCQSSVVTGEHIALSAFPSIKLSNGEKHVSRIAYLAEIRNRLLRPLDNKYSNDPSGFASAAHIKFDQILFLNDVYFSPREASHLLFSTNKHEGRARYRAACAVDFIRGAQFYDTFVVRDAEGYSNGFMVYPWFSTAGHAASRVAVLAGSDAVPVRSCWGGMAAFDAALFQTRDAASPFTSRGDYELLKFRSSEELYWEAAECCLIFADIEEQFGKPDPAQGTGVFLNPHVRVAYSKTTWNLLPIFRRFERVFEYLQYVLSKLAYPEHNPRRLQEPGELVNTTVWRAEDTAVAATSSLSNAQPGGFCGQRRLFVMKGDIELANVQHTGKNWEAIKVP